MKKVFFPFISILALMGTFFIAPALAQQDDSPVVGTWSSSSSEIEISGSNGAYDGVVTKEFTFEDCVHQKGEVIWQLLGNGSGSIETSGITFMGSFQGYVDPPNCLSSLATGDFKITKVGGTLTLTACPSWGGACIVLTRPDEPKDTTSPTIKFNVDKTITPMSLPIYQMFWIFDNSPSVTVTVSLFSDGHQVTSDADYTFNLATGADQDHMVTFSHVTNEKGPFYICVVAKDKAGNSSGRFNNCVWRSVEVPLAILSNGCGSQDYGSVATHLQNWFLNTTKFIKSQISALGSTMTEYYVVNVKPACDNHDGGYQGSTFKDAISGKIIDTRLMTRQQVDIKFKQDIATLCSKAGLPTNRLVECIGGPLYSLGGVTQYAKGTAIGANTYATAVSAVAIKGFDSNSTVPLAQTKIPATTQPSGGARNNKSDENAVAKARVSVTTKK
jgi:hypothetical protein